METPSKAETALEPSAATRKQSSASNALSARSRRRSSFALAAVVAGAFFATLASSSAQAAQNYVPGQLLVTFNVNPASASAQRINAFAKASPKTTFQFIKTQLVTLPKGASLNSAMATYLGQSAVEAVQPNYIYRKFANPNDPLYKKQQYGPQKVSAPRVWDFTTGSRNLVVAVVDTGVAYSHPDLAPNMWRNTSEVPGNGLDDDGNGIIDDVFGINAVKSDKVTGNPLDDDAEGHGTHVAGTVGAVGNNKTGVTGMNWGVQIMALKFLGADGKGSTSGAITCMQYMLQMKNRGVNVRVANHSWGSEDLEGNGADPALKKAFDDTGNAGIINVCAAGNGGGDGIGDNNDGSAVFPAGFDSPGLISVAASDKKDNLASFTNTGRTSVDLSAPGVDIISTSPFTPAVTKRKKDGTVVIVKPAMPGVPGYQFLSGTSMASPHVAGAAALLAAYYPTSSVQEIKDALLLGVDPINSQANRTVTGGRLNVARSLGLPDKKKKPGKGGSGAPTRPFPFPPGTGPAPQPSATGTGTNPTATGTGTNPTATGTGVNPTATGTGLPPGATETPGGLPTPSPTAPPTATPIGQTPTAAPTAGPIVGKKNGPIVFTSDRVYGSFSRQVFKTTANITAVGQLNEGAVISQSSVSDFNPSTSLDTGKIAFASNLPIIQNVDFDPDRNEIYVMDQNGQNVTRLTNDNQQANKPTNDQDTAITPNGNFVVFASKQGGQLNGNNEVINGSGTSDSSRFRFFIIPTTVDTQGFVPPKRLLLQGNLINGVLDQDVRNATFSPDGTKIAFQSNIFGNWDIFLADFDQNIGAITSKPVRITDNPGDDVDPTIGSVTATSPAGSTGRLAFASSRVATNTGGNNFFGNVPNFNILKLEKLLPETPQRASTNPAIPVTDFSYGRFGGVPDYSYGTPQTGGPLLPGDDYGFLATSYTVTVFDQDGNATNETRNREFFGGFETGDELHPTFSPDGTLIAFISNTVLSGVGITSDPKTTNPDNDFDIFTISADDSRNFNRLTDNKPTRTRNEGATGYTSSNALYVIDAEPIWGADISTPTSAPGGGRGGELSAFGVTSAPVTFNNSISAGIGATTTIKLQGEQAQQFVIVRNPENGVLRGEGANRTYTPLPGYEGADQFTYVAKNGLGQSEIATVKIDVKAPEMPRASIGDTASSIANQTVTVTFASALDAASAANAERYSVFVNGVPTDIENGQFSSIDNALTLTLPQGTLHKGDKVIVQWEKLRNFEGKALQNGKAQFTVR